VGAVESSLHQRLKYIVNGRLIIVKMEEMFSMLKYMLALYIEVKRKKRWRYSCFQGCEYGFGA
jgi:hypothetical protein